MFSKLDRRQILRRSLLTLALLVVLIGIGVLFNAVAARRNANEYELAGDFPRGALVYAQFSDLPAMLKSWDESALKSRYWVSASFQQLQTRHLAMKLVSRWAEFNDATGFAIDTGVLGSLADNRAAIAVYDIGRLDLALVAPIGEAKLAACRFIQGKDNFEEIALPGGAVYYLHDVEADNGRQKQQIGFAAIKGKFVLATNEKLLLRAIANLNGPLNKEAMKDRLSDDPSFQTLSKSVAPHFATVWVDQAKLNDDWYFKRYWLMSNASDLKHIRAAMFDLEPRQDQWIERREFLTAGNRLKTPAAIAPQTHQQIAAIVPAGAPFVQLRVADGGTAALVADSLFEREEQAGARKPRGWHWDNYDDGDFEVGPEEEGYDGSSRYSYLSHRYNLFVDDPDDAEEWEADDSSTARTARDRKALAQLRGALDAAGPVAAAKLAQPRAIEGPLFAEFGRAAIVVLRNPAVLDVRALEQAMAEMASNQLLVAGARMKFEWRSHREEGRAGGVEWREMELPALGRRVGYGLRNSALIVSNNPDLLARLMTNRQQGAAIAPSSPVHELTLIRLNQRAEAFDRIFAKLDEPRVKVYWKERKGDQAAPSDPSQEFFSGNIASLLDVASPVAEARIERSYTIGGMRETVSLTIR
ncbi:MAG: hypothetical protein ACREEM_25820 [Blastocatellia bacterium]